MKRFQYTLILLLTVLVLAAVLMSASAQADPPAPVGPEPLLPCTRLADDTHSDADPAASPLAALEAFLAQLRENPFDPHVEDLAHCYPLLVEPDTMPTVA